MFPTLGASSLGQKGLKCVKMCSELLLYLNTLVIVWIIKYCGGKGFILYLPLWHIFFFYLSCFKKYNYTKKKQPLTHSQKEINTFTKTSILL